MECRRASKPRLRARSIHLAAAVDFLNLLATGFAFCYVYFDQRMRDFVEQHEPARRYCVTIEQR
jgi:hypothetical protein